VLLSIVLGLALTQVLQGYRALLLAKGRVRHSATVLIWSAILMAIVAQAWWASFGLRDRTHWDFLTFAVILAQMGLIYMAAAVVFPDIGSSGQVDLTDHWDRHRKPFFAFLLAMLASSLLKSIALDGRLPRTLDLLFPVLLAAIAIIGVLARKARIQLFLACSTAGLLIAYVALLFARI
ncbi:MAG TPA: hypothetical protein VE820_00015, partial [Sphingomicrobium sp.]|nr:hypothetical protein [Sphingomicrobium sp.]